MFNRDDTARIGYGPIQWFIAMAMTVTTGLVAAEPIEFNGFVFDAPESWTTQSRDEDKLTMTPVSADLTPILALSSRKLTSQNQIKLLRQWHRSQLPPRSGQKLAVKSGRLTNGVSAWLVESASPGAKGRSKSNRLISLALEFEDQLLLASLTTSTETGTTQSASPQSVNPQLASLAHLLISARLSAPDKPIPGKWSAPQRELSGFYATIGSSVSLSLLARNKHVVGINGLLLKEDGRFGLTVTSMGENLSGYCDEQQTACGRYDATDQHITIWRSANTTEQALNFMRGEQRSLIVEDGGTLIVGGAKYQRILPDERATLDGRFRSAKTEKMDGPDGDELNAYKETIFTFHADGQFEQSELKALTRASTGTPISLSSAAAPKRGTYQIADYELELNIENAEPVSLSLFMLQGVPVIDGSMYKRIRPFVPLAKPDSEKKSNND